MTSTRGGTDPIHTVRPDAFQWRFTTPLYVGAALNPVNSSLLATALVPIATAMRVPVGRTSVLVAALYLASAVAQPTAGKVAEVFGPRRVFLVGIVLVLLGGLVGGTGRNLTTLVVARVLIGVGTSAGYPAAMVLIRRRAAWAGLDEPPGGVLGGLSVAGQVTAAVGLPIGGVLVGAAGWRVTFLVNIPVTLAALAMTLAWIPADAPTARQRLGEVWVRLDVGGIIGFGAAMTALLVFLLGLPDPDWIALGIAVVVAAALVCWELRAGAPFLDVRLLATNLALTRTYLRMGLTLLGVYSVLYGITQWLEEGRGLSPEQAGLLILPMSGLAAVVSGPVSRRNLVRGPLVAAASASLLGSLGILALTSHTPTILIVAVTLVFGVTVGTTAVGNQLALYAQSPPGQVGTAAGLFRTFGYVGSITSSAITGIVFRTSVTDRGLHVIAVTLVAVSAAVLLLTVADRRLVTAARPRTGGGPLPSTPAPENP